MPPKIYPMKKVSPKGTPMRAEPMGAPVAPHPMPVTVFGQVSAKSKAQIKPYRPKLVRK